MTIKQLRELDAWIAEHVMGWKQSNSDFCQLVTQSGEQVGEPVCDPWSPTTNPAAAMAVWQSCLEKVSTKSIETYIGVDESPEYRPVVCITMKEMKNTVMADTLPLAICLFAKEIFSK